MAKKRGILPDIPPFTKGNYLFLALWGEKRIKLGKTLWCDIYLFGNWGTAFRGCLFTWHGIMYQRFMKICLQTWPSPIHELWYWAWKQIIRTIKTHLSVAAADIRSLNTSTRFEVEAILKALPISKTSDDPNDFEWREKIYGSRGHSLNCWFYSSSEYFIFVHHCW